MSRVQLIRAKGTPRLIYYKNKLFALLFANKSPPHPTAPIFSKVKLLSLSFHSVQRVENAPYLCPRQRKLSLSAADTPSKWSYTSHAIMTPA